MDDIHTHYRVSKHEVAMEVARSYAKRTTCARRGVGCVITNETGHVLSIGYNGSPAGTPHCSGGHPCLGGVEASSGQSLELCRAIHAEQNAIARLADWESAHAIYCTTSPCNSCIKLIAATNIRLIYVDKPYPGNSEEFWLAINPDNRWIQM